jgi:RNA polymerase sigma-32 factor
MVRIGRTMPQKALFLAVRRLRAQLDHATTRVETRQVLARQCGVSVLEVEAMEQIVSNGHLSLNAPLAGEGSEAWQDQLVDDADSPEHLVMRSRDSEKRSGLLRKALKHLPPRDRAIIRARHLSEERRTLDDLGQEFGISKERVRQLEQRAIDEVRRSMQSALASEIA